MLRHRYLLRAARIASIVPISHMSASSVSSGGGSITVEPPVSASIDRKRGDHWKTDFPKGFKNPWDSASPPAGFFEMTKFLRQHSKLSSNDPDIANFHNLVKQVTPDFGRSLPQRQIKATWLSHASFLVEMPIESGSDGNQGRGVRILFDPAYSNRCSPFQSFGGNARYSPPPVTGAEVPQVDIIAISHNHYDHCDLNTLREIYTTQKERPPILFVGLNGANTLRSTVGQTTQIVEMDWWEDRTVHVEGVGTVRVTCTPCQHNCARGLFDRDDSLWASWAVHSLSSTGQTTGASAWHAGDTGYCSTKREEEASHTIDPAEPVCPAFKEIGEKLGPFSVGMIPIGAFAPRHIMSTVHNAPIDAVRMYKDTRCKKAIGMHWGTWRMALDRIAEPAERMPAARDQVGVTEEQFGLLALGETKGYDP